MVINGKRVIVQPPYKSVRFKRVGISKSKVGSRRVRISTIILENLMKDSDAFIYKDTIIVSPAMYEKLKNVQESHSLCGRFPNSIAY
jgi:hypothetical protein